MIGQMIGLNKGDNFGFYREKGSNPKSNSNSIELAKLSGDSANRHPTEIEQENLGGNGPINSPDLSQTNTVPVGPPNLHTGDIVSFQPDSRFALIFRELWKGHKLALVGGALQIIAAGLVNAFVGVLTLGALSIPAGTLSVSTFSAGYTCIWWAFLQACAAGNKEYGYQQQFVSDRHAGETMLNYKAYRLQRITAEFQANNS